MEQQSLSDALTGLPNRRYANNRLKQCVMEASRTRLPLSVMMLDLDHFKDVNDVYGHSVGDTVLKAVAEVFQRVCRGSDEVCRQGGEEFLVISRNTGVDAAAVAANRIREAVGELVFGDTHKFQVTLSVGVCQLEEGETDTENMLHMADLALYDAKHSGRNCVRLASPFDRSDNCVNIEGSAA
jgi:two-component system cell cycle response regulator